MLEYEWQLVTRKSKKQNNYIGADKAKALHLKECRRQL